jgi:hypothetical protein
MTSTLMSSAATLGSPCCNSCLTVLLPSLCCPGAALADTLAPDPVSLCDGHHLGAAPAIAPHPDVHLVEPAAVVPVLLRVGGGASESKTLIVLHTILHMIQKCCKNLIVFCHVPVWQTPGRGP